MFVEGVRLFMVVLGTAAGYWVSRSFGAAGSGLEGLGGMLGCLAGYVGGAPDEVLMLVSDGMLAIPRLPLLMIAAVVLQPSVPLLIVIIGLAGVTSSFAALAWSRRREFGVLRFLGLTRREVLRLLALEGAATGSLGARHAGR